MSFPVAYILLAVAVFILGIILRTKKGAIGEKRVSRRLNRLPEEEYVVLDDLMIRTKSGRTTQIDHVVVSVYGVFVVETKNYSGWITGSESSEYWTKNMYGNKYQFRNPILQNAGHVRAIKNVVNGIDGCSDVRVVPIVAFSGQADLKVHVANAKVIYWRDLRSTIERYDDRVLTRSQVIEIVDTLKSLNIDSRDERKQHVRSVKVNASRTAGKIASGTCPRCGGHLVERNGMYGRFWGCSNYPKCRFTLNDN